MLTHKSPYKSQKMKQHDISSSSLDFDFEGRMWDLIVSVPDHCLSFYFIKAQVCKVDVCFKHSVEAYVFK